MTKKSLSEQEIREIEQALLGGNKIEAIKLYREFTGVDLKTAKEIIDQMEVGSPQEFAEIAQKYQQSTELSVEQLEQIDKELRAANKIGAIKLYRSFTNKGLKESKEFVDDFHAELNRQFPGIYPQAKGCAMLIAVSAIIVFACASKMAPLLSVLF